jgi:hypothetical protein
MTDKLLSDLSRENCLQLDSILSSGVPWLKLDLEIPEFPAQILDDAIAASSGWHDRWCEKTPLYPGYHLWDGKVLFGPTNWNQWMDLVTSEPQEDEDGLSKKYRHEIEFGWQIDLDHPVRKWVNSFLDDAAINLVNYYVLGPGGYLPPHYDACVGKKWLNKIYAAVAWPADCEFGFLDWGNMPIQQGDVFLINHYQYPHWVINRGDQHRIVLHISCDLTHVQDLIKRSFLRR